MLRLRAALAALALLLAGPAWAAVEIQEVTSPGGTRAWLVEEPSIPFTALELRFRGGTALDAPGKRGAVNLMTALLEEGAGEMDAREFTVAAEGLAASFSFDARGDSVAVSARFLSENRDEAAALLRAALTEPRFDADAIERVRAQVLSVIASDAADPGAVAARAFDAAAFGDHPYGSDPSGTAQSVAALTRDDLVVAWRGAIARDRIYAAAVGDISAEGLGTLLDEVLGGLPETGAPVPPAVEAAPTPGVDVIPFDTPQSVIVFGHEGILRDDPDFIPAYVLNEILGGSGRQSRLMEEVREKRGLTYGIGTYLAPRDLGATIQGSVATANATAGEVVDLVRAEWARAAEEGVSGAELAEIVTYLTGAYPLRFDGNGPIADILVGMQMQGLPTSYVEERNALVEAVTPEDLARVAERILRPEGLSFVVVGRPEGLEGAAPEIPSGAAALQEAAPTPAAAPAAGGCGGLRPGGRCRQPWPRAAIACPCGALLGRGA